MANMLAERIGAAALPLFLAMLVVTLASIALVWHWLMAEHPWLWQRGEALWHWLRSQPSVAWLGRRFPRTLAWLRRRLTPGGYLGVHLTLGLLVSVIALGIFGGLAVQVAEQEGLAAFDVALAKGLADHATPWQLRLFAAITTLGGLSALLALGLAVSALLLVRRRWLLLVGWAVALGGGGLLNFELKVLYQRTRPELLDPYIVEQGWSFPSGHAMGSLIAYGMLSYLLVLWLRAPWDRAVVVAATALVLLIGFSRIYLGVHYLSDVVAGYAAGTIWLTACISGLEVARRRRSLREREAHEARAAPGL